MKPALYDCFCYFNEDMLLELRLETLWDTVDYFVICESRYTQAGKEKLLNFSLEKFSKYKDKIRYLVASDAPGGESDPWKNENYQRDYLARGLYDAKPDDLILISDLDEIPRPESIALYNPKYLRGDFEQRCYAYYLNNLRLGKSEPFFWKGSRITTYRHFVNFFKSSAQSVRFYKYSGLLRSFKRDLFKLLRVQSLKDAGWHFTWVLTPEQMIYKIENMAHQEFNLPHYKETQQKF